jgi:hydrogenase-4 membrane subunit HyfE
MVCSLIPLQRSRSAQLWLAGALTLVALMRANQVIFFWGEFESVHGFEFITDVLLVPLMIGAWTIAWCQWLQLSARRWIVPAAAALTGLHIGLQCLHASWFYGVLPHAVDVVLAACVSAVRALFVLMMISILVGTARQPGRERWFALPAIVLICIGLFARELSLLHVPGIWFPFGTGVSRTQYAYAAFDIALFALLSRRVTTIARGWPRGTVA